MCAVTFSKGDRGQVLCVVAVLLPALILFAGLGLDTGVLYVTKAKLTTSVDAACLTTMKNLQLGQTAAAALGANIFASNFGANAPTPSITFPTDANGAQLVKVTATANVHTAFMQYLPNLATVPVSATAAATRGKLVMSLVLDRSGSMSSNGGETALQYAVPNFVTNFSDSNDEVAMVSFSSNSTVDFAMNYNFTTTITNKVKAMTATGATFGSGIGTRSILSTTTGPPLSLADLQNNSVTVQSGENVIKVIVYFTDGLMNAVQDNFYCLGKNGNGTTQTLINYGGCDATGSCDPQVHFLDPTSATTDWGYYGEYATGFPYNTSHTTCQDKNGHNVTTFSPQDTTDLGSSSTFTRAHVTQEAQYRAIQTAIAMRTETVPTYIFTIGMGSGVTTSTQAFLAQLANDPSYPATYIKGQPSGLFFYIPSCSGTFLASCKNELNTAFQTIAAKVLLRMTQ